MPIESRIIVNINALVTGLAEVRQLAFSVEGLGKSAGGSASTGLGKLDSSLTKSQRSAAKLTSDIRKLKAELDTLNKKIARDGQFATPSDRGRAQDLGAAIANRERTLNQQNHLQAAANIRARREQLLESQRVTAADLKQKEAAAQADFDKRIGARIAKRKQDTAAATAAAAAEARGIQRVSRLANLALSPLRGIGNFVVGIFRQVVRQIEFAAAAFVLFTLASPALVFGALIKEGIEFNSVMEQASIGLSALLQATQIIFRKEQPNKPLEGIEKFKAASVIAVEVADRLQRKLIPLKATSEELIPIFNQIVTAAAGAGFTIEQTEDTFISLAAAAQILQIPVERLGTEIRLFITGTTRATSRLGPALFGSAAAAREFVKQHKAIGDLFPALQTKLAAYNASLLVSTSSYAVLFQNAKEVFQQLSRLATSGLFDQLKQALIKVTQGVFDLDKRDIKPKFLALFDFINANLNRVGVRINEAIETAIDLLGQLSTYIRDNRQEAQLLLDAIIEIGKQLGGIVLDTLKIVNHTDKAVDKTGGWRTALQDVGEIIALIRDMVNVVLGAFESLAAVIALAVLVPLEKVLEVLGWISDGAQKAAIQVRKARRGAQEFFWESGEQFENGVHLKESLALRDYNDETERLLAIGEPDVRGLTFRPFVPGRTREQRAKDLGLTPDPSFKTPSGDGGSGGSEKVLNRLAELRKRSVELLRSLYETRSEIERAGEARSFELHKTSTDRQLQILDDNLQHRLISTVDYYKKKGEIESAAILRERRHLADQFRFEERETAAQIDAIHSEFNEQLRAPKNKDSRIQAELGTQRQLRIDAELNKLEAKRVKLNGDILGLDQKQLEVTRLNNQGTEDGLETLRKTTEEIQQQLLDAQGRNTAAEIRRIAEQYKDQLLQVLTETNPATDALTEVIEGIRTLGSVTSEQLLGVLAQAGFRFEDLSDDAKALVRLMRKLEDSAIFTGLQKESQTLLGGLDLQRADIQDKVNLGLTNEVKGRHLVALAEREVLVEIKRVIAEMEALPKLTDDQKLALAQLKQQAAQMGREVDALGETINDSIKGNIDTFTDSLFDDFQHLGANAREFFRNLLIDIGKAIVKGVILKRLFDFLGLNKVGTTGPGSAGGLGGIVSKLIGFADGGYVDGQSGGRDTLLARLTRGEWIVPAARVRQYAGTGLLQSITSGTFGKLGTVPERGLSALGRSKQLPPKVVIAMGEEQIANASMGRYGEKVWMFHFNNNKRGLQG